MIDSNFSFAKRVELKPEHIQGNLSMQFLEERGFEDGELSKDFYHVQ